MVIFRSLTLSILVLSFLTECDTKQSDNNTTEISIQPPLTQIQNKFTGEWKHDNTIWYTSELTIQDNGTFKFHNQGCYGKNFTEGQWTNNNGTIILSSFISFKQTEEINKTHSVKIEESQSVKPKLKKGEAEYSFVDFKEVSPPILRGPNDTIRVYFDKVQLKLNRDTLFCIDQNKFIADHKFIRTKNYR